MLELLYHKRNHLITTVVDGSIFTSNHIFDRAIWDIALANFWKIRKFNIFKNHEGDLSLKPPETENNFAKNLAKCQNLLKNFVSHIKVIPRKDTFLCYWKSQISFNEILFWHQSKSSSK